MVDILITQEFERRFQELPSSVQRSAEKQERLFRENPFHPSLHTEKLHPKGREVWSLRVDRSYRIVFRFIKPGRAIFLTIGPHDWIYRFRW